LETSRSTLELEADSATFRDTKLRLRCVASLFQLYHRSSEELELHEDTPQLASVLGPSIAGESLPPFTNKEIQKLAFRCIFYPCYYLPFLCLSSVLLFTVIRGSLTKSWQLFFFHGIPVHNRYFYMQHLH
ncbi:hypothetical protein C0J52_14476, partial [Blattella germanica]